MSEKNKPKLYAERDVEEMFGLYLQHVEAMTAEGLHEKSAIAAELAYRDYTINHLIDIIKEMETII